MERKTHWEDVYNTKSPDEVSWYQPHAQRSLELIRTVAPAPGTAVLDVGGGASTLVDDLLAAGYRQLTVLDLSSAALARSRDRLGPAAETVRWLEADILDVALPASGFDVWHDRAVFHFLTAEHDQQRYLAQVRHALKPGGHVVIATFSEAGPTRCSGLDVRRYSPEALQTAFGPDFELLASEREVHTTPARRPQAFVYCVFRLRPA